jgi:hypothetical protein
VSPSDQSADSTADSAGGIRFFRFLTSLANGIPKHPEMFDLDRAFLDRCSGVR